MGISVFRGIGQLFRVGFVVFTYRTKLPLTLYMSLSSSSSPSSLNNDIIQKDTRMANKESYYRIGTPGKEWGETEIAEWKSQVELQRSYQDEVLSKLHGGIVDKSIFEVVQYGALPQDPDRYPLFVVQSKDWSETKPSVVITGGVHGYETSGVQGALLFVEKYAAEYAKQFNMIIAVCISPWSYEHIQRWQFDTMDPNRSFKPNETTPESKFFMDYIHKVQTEKNISSWKMHIDLHETTNTDNTEFMPAKAAKAGKETCELDPIPDGFYLVGDSTNNPQLPWLQAIIQAVSAVTHIAPPDDKECIIGEKIVSDGIILFPSKELGLCAGSTNAEYSSTTEVYPDSPKATDEICNQAQAAAAKAGLDFILAQGK